MLLIGLMASLPFLVPSHNLPITSFQSEWLAMLLGVVAMLALVSGKIRNSLHVPRLVVAPGRAEAGGLGALSGEDDCDGHEGLLQRLGRCVGSARREPGDAMRGTYARLRPRHPIRVAPLVFRYANGMEHACEQAMLL